MNREIEDPKWTAYLLGECTAEEKARAEEKLAADPELAKEVELLKDALEQVRTEVQSSADAPELDPLRRESVLQAERKHRRTPARYWGPTAAAALLFLTFGITRFLIRDTETRQSEALRETTEAPVPGLSEPEMEMAQPEVSDRSRRNEERNGKPASFKKAHAPEPQTVTDRAPVIIDSGKNMMAVPASSPPAEAPEREESPPMDFGAGGAGEARLSRGLSEEAVVDQELPADENGEADVLPEPTPTPTPTPTPLPAPPAR